MKISLICFDCGKKVSLLPVKKDDDEHFMFVVPCTCNVAPQNAQIDSVHTVTECPICSEFHEHGHGDLS